MGSLDGKRENNERRSTLQITINAGNREIFLSETITSTFFAAIILIVLGFVVRSKLKKANVDEEPRGFLNVIEAYVEMVTNLVESTMGKQNLKFAPFIFMLFSFLIVSNVMGIFGLQSPTADYSVALALALTTFILIQVFGVISAGGVFKYLKTFFEPFSLMAPLNFVSELSNPVSLSFRLFGNILSGGLIMSLLHAALGIFAPIVAPPFHMYFDMFSGILQAFIFVMLTMVFISDVTE